MCGALVREESDGAWRLESLVHAVLVRPSGGTLIYFPSQGNKKEAIRAGEKDGEPVRRVRRGRNVRMLRIVESAGTVPADSLCYAQRPNPLL